MKTTADLVKGWIRKGDSDLENVRPCVTSGMALDAACFHAQQAAEKFIKAYMIAYGMSAPFIHNLENLLEKCEQQDTSFSQMKALGQILTPYAVQLRYDGDFWPTAGEATTALQTAEALRAFIIPLLPPLMQPPK